MEDGINSKKMYIILGVVLIVIFALGTRLIKFNNESIINYNKIKSGQDLISSATLTYERSIYYTLEDIITNFISSYNIRNFDSNVSSYEEYYEVLNDSYKYRLGKEQYLKLSQSFFKHFEFLSDGMDPTTVYVSQNIIRSIYDLGEDRYVCKLSVYGKEDYGYIGIKLNPSKKSYEIFYLE